MRARWGGRTQGGMSAIQPRQPKGRPIGGQWAQFEHAESAVALVSAPTDESRLAMAERRERLRLHGYVGATTVPAAVAPTTTEHRDVWWDNSFVSAEYGRGEGRTYPQMPDDETPNRHEGQAMSGHRRTHRMHYSNEQIDLRMPSVTAIRRYSAAHGNPTFDVPVSVSVRGGQPVNGWVRVTKTGPHDWTVTTADGTNTRASLEVAEAVTALLESRRVTTALARIPDLLEARRQRIAAQGSAMTDLNSSFLQEAGYDRATQTTAVKIANRLYGFRTSPAHFEALKDSSRPGALFNQIIKKCAGTEVRQCPKCQRFHSAAVAHRCPAGHKAGTGLESGYSHAAEQRAFTVAARRSHGVGADVPAVLPPDAPVRTAPGPGSQPVPPRGTGFPAPPRAAANPGQA